MNKCLDEKFRLETVRKFSIVENSKNKSFDEITQTVALTCNSKVCLISIVDEQVIHFISKYGFDFNEIPRNKTPCDIVVKIKKPLIIEDTSLYKGEDILKPCIEGMDLLFYAGFPLITKEGVTIGTLSVADDKVKVLSDSQVLLLETFAKQVVNNLEMNKANIELKKMEKQFREVQEICDIGYWELCILTGRVIWTSGVYEIYGLASDVHIDSEQYLSCFPPHERDRLNLAIDKAIKEGTSYGEDFEFKDNNGIKKWVRAFGQAVSDSNGNLVKLVGTFQDITNIRTQEQSQQLIIETMKVGTFKWDIKNNLLEWDDSNYNVFNVNREDFCGAYKAWEDALHPDWKEVAVADLEKALKDSNEFLSTFGIYGPEGETRYIGARGNIIRDDSGEPIGMIGINWDKTSEHEALMLLEKQKLHSFHQDKLASLGALAAGVGHEINNPMAIIQGHCDFLKNRIGKDNLRRQQLSSSLEQIAKSVERVTLIVKGLKNISRHDGDDVETFVVNDVIQESVSTISDIYQKEGINIELNMCGDLILLGNRGRLQQVLINLLINAKDAVESKKNKEIKVSLFSKNNESIFIEVKDNGCGIPLEIQNKVFDPFFTSKEISKGTGIGLSLCHQIITNHHGEIGFETSIDHGTVFRIQLPLSKTHVLVVNKTREYEDCSSLFINKNILIAEDEKGIQEILKVILEDLGFGVVMTDNGLEALNEYNLNKNKYDLILSDIQMPHMTGLELLNILDIEDPQRLPFIVMTGGVNADDESYANQVDGIISKPFTKESLEMMLKKVLNERDLLMSLKA